ncbi:MAG: endonuclease/exonuclease/phosphatase family protein, partial [Paracoccaceae bacterium]
TAYGPAFDMDASTTANGRVFNRRRQFGTMILSRWPILWSRLHLLPMRRMIDPLNTQNPALECLIHTPAGPIRFLSIHLAHVGCEERLAQIDHLLALHHAVPAQGGPWSGTDDEPLRDWTHGEAEPACPQTAIWLGDFNCEPGSAEHARITGHSPYHPGARYTGGLSNATPADAALHTHVKVIDGQLTKRQLDHCFVSTNLVPRVRAVTVRNDDSASDHHPLWVEIDLETPLV